MLPFIEFLQYTRYRGKYYILGFILWDTVNWAVLATLYEGGSWAYLEAEELF